MSLFWILIIGLIVFLLTAGITEFFRIGNAKPTPKKTSSYRPTLLKRDFECREYWAPDALSRRTNEISVKNENMAAVEGYHNVKR